MRHELFGRTIDNARGEPLLIAQHLLGWCFQVPHDAEPGHRPQNVIRWVDLPPFEALPHAALVRVVIVVPSFAHGEYCQQPVVA